jgi:LemA protein
MKKTLFIVLGVVAIIAIYAWSTYNNMIGINESVDNQWAQVETQYQRRVDLIPNLVESVKGAMGQEQKVFGDLAEARTRYAGAQTQSDKTVATNQVESALGRLLVVMENYPQLKSVDTVQTLMAQLEGTENRVSVERKRFNDMAQQFNTTIKRIPAKWLAAWYGFGEKTYFAAQAGAENAPAVKF